MSLDAFPDVERAIVAIVSDLADGGSSTRPTLNDDVPFVRVTRLGGGDNRITDSAAVTVDAFHTTRDQAFALAEAVRQRLLDFPHVVDGAVIDRVSTTAGPQEIPWAAGGKSVRAVASASVRCFTASYTVQARRR